LTRDELTHLIGTFGALRIRDEKLHGRFLTAELVLSAHDRLT
jgi:hypothetical protein